MALTQFFRDGQDAYSMKRLVFFLFALVWIIMAFTHYDTSGAERMVVWLGGFILAEDVAPDVATSLSGSKSGTHSS